MPNADSILSDRRMSAIAQLERELLEPWGARRLLKHELQSYKKRQFVDGWRLRLRFDDQVRQLNLLVRSDFPYVPLTIALVNGPKFLTWPHFEEDGVLCVWPDSVSFSSRNVIGVTKGLLSDVEELISKSAKGENRDNFLIEFHPYWNRSLGANATPFLSLLAPNAPSRLISVNRGTRRFVFGENEEVVESWLRNRFGSKQSVQCDKAAFLWLNRPLYPEEYPKTAKDVWGIARDLSVDASDLLEKLSEAETRRAVIMFGAESTNGPCLAGIMVGAPEHRSSTGKAVSSLNKGFRPGHVPASLLANRFWQASSPVRRSSVERIDSKWIHGRGEDDRQPSLVSQRVAVIGCGSVGAPIAVQLAMSGVGELRLIDPGKLESANTGRHPLGAKYVGKNKAMSLAEELKEKYPHILVDARPESWQDVMRREPGRLDSCNLIISATGDWGSEEELNDWNVNMGRAIPILYSWTEEHACAGHAVAIVKQGGCLECGFHNKGTPRLKVTNWLTETLKQEPGCGSLYQPYGPMELAYTITLGAGLALDVLLGKVTESTHHVWACREQFLTECGGEWNSEWLKLTGGDPRGGLVLTRPWRELSTCVGCSAKGMAA